MTHHHNCGLCGHAYFRRTTVGHDRVWIVETCAGCGSIRVPAELGGVLVPPPKPPAGCAVQDRPGTHSRPMTGNNGRL